jgi:hypothetical protein
MSYEKTNSKSDASKSLLVIVVGFLTLYFFFHHKLLLYTSLGIGIISVVSDKASYLILWIWSKLGFLLGWVNTRILLTIVFFIFLYPISLLFRLYNKNPLRITKSNESLFDIRNHTYTKEDLENIW